MCKQKQFTDRSNYRQNPANTGKSSGNCLALICVLLLRWDGSRSNNAQMFRNKKGKDRAIIATGLSLSPSQSGEIDENLFYATQSMPHCCSSAYFSRYWSKTLISLFISRRSALNAAPVRVGDFCHQQKSLLYWVSKPTRRTDSITHEISQMKIDHDRTQSGIDRYTLSRDDRVTDTRRQDFLINSQDALTRNTSKQ